MNIKRAKRLIKLCIESKVSTLLVGHSGVGKTSVIRQIAEENFPGHELVTIIASQQDPGDFVGIPYLESKEGTNTKTTNWARPKWMPEGPCIIFLDELNQAPRDVEAALFQLVHEKRIHQHKLHPDSAIVAAVNPPGKEYTTANPMSSALVKRFVVIPFKPDTEEFLDWGQSSGKIHGNLVKFLRSNEEDAGLSKELETGFQLEPCPRLLADITKVINTAELKDPKASENEELMQDLLTNSVGIHTAAKYLSFLKSKERPLTFDQITNDWDNTKEIFDSYRNNLKNDLVTETVRNFTEGMKTIPSQYVDSIEFNVPPIQVDSDQEKEAKEAIKEVSKNINKIFKKKQRENVAAFLTALPNDLFFSVTRDIFVHNPIVSTDDDIEKNRNLINILWSLIAYFWGEKFTDKENVFERVEQERDNIEQYIKSSENQEKVG